MFAGHSDRGRRAQRYREGQILPAVQARHRAVDRTKGFVEGPLPTLTTSLVSRFGYHVGHQQWPDRQQIGQVDREILEHRMCQPDTQLVCVSGLQPPFG